MPPSCMDAILITRTCLSARCVQEKALDNKIFHLFIHKQISRESIDAVKNYFREDLQKSDWQLMIELKKLLNIY